MTGSRQADTQALQVRGDFLRSYCDEAPGASAA